MHVERLSKLADVLENLPEERALMRPPPGKRTVPTKFKIDTWTSCGTTACAIGYAAIHPWFTRRGLKLQRIGFPTIPVFQGECGGMAIRKFFDLSNRDAFYLFYRDGFYIRDEGKRAVARRIRGFIKELGLSKGK